ncbi:UDP-N-acetylmuramoyl-tripeptide--D-alanyl-D-alanine ligase [Anaerosporomusa subterranea]|uniref:UDP-N-acetylmuramoyl-tripeptide--D-alanyl-D-alanine ligase n=1 Tax=Anaerosporomusa subterranea TaxID=1794912 RepID=A0A154BT47_ANASB|nr:UDP-N-acetylmuramoyl-tripeptide--D-alanyl-D-alanine ligase [Anaerosporomusa subterranea]KYZ77101.1 UDP-N-acetylmuramoyl-tripeptide--D-alanyl-D-alanine ligase [Anaerosporomusa subterranea]
MAEFLLQEVLTATGGSASSDKMTRFCSISTDTRLLQPGSLFIALSGEHFDGHNYLNTAAENGAVGVIVSRRDIAVPAGVIVIVVADTRRALQDLARFHRQRFSGPVIAITGSNGKTTTKDMTAAVLSSRLSTLKTQANFNNEIGLPLTLLRLDQSHQVAVVEMGMRGKGEIQELAAIALPTIGVVTTVGETHIELLGSVENIAAAKAELVEAIPEDGTVILNGDNPLVRAMAKKTPAKIVFYGMVDAEVTAKAIIQTETGMSFDCCWPNQSFRVDLATFGRHNIYNALAAIAVGRELGLTPAEICQGIASFVPDGMRLQVQAIGQYRVINDAYNASPLSMAASIEALKDIAAGRTVAVLGDMLELGDFAVEAHRKIGEKLAAQRIDLVITVGNLSRNIAQAAMEVGLHVEACDNHEAARQMLKKFLRAGDTVLLKGSRGMKMEQLLDVFA